MTYEVTEVMRHMEGMDLDMAHLNGLVERHKDAKSRESAIILAATTMLRLQRVYIDNPFMELV